MGTDPRVVVPFLDLGSTYQELALDLDAAFHRVMDSGWYVLGDEVRQFEAEFARYAGADSCVGVASGLDALTLALRAVEVGPGDEVIVPSNTYIATWLAVSAVGATPVPVEPDLTTQNISASSIEACITDRTRVVLPVHLYGQPVDMEPIVALAHRHGLRVISDAAQAHGARILGRPIGGVGDMVCWSFYPGKNLGAFGDGGAVTTNSPELADQVNVMRNYGSRVKYVNDVRGVNSRLDELQAALLRVKLSHLDEWNGRRAAIASSYMEGLDGLDGLVLPHQSPDAASSWHLFVVRHPDRDHIQQALADAGVQTLIHYPIPPHRQAAYSDLTFRPLPIAEMLADQVLSLPIGPHLGSRQVDAVVEAVTGVLRRG